MIFPIVTFLVKSLFLGGNLLGEKCDISSSKPCSQNLECIFDPSTSITTCICPSPKIYNSKIKSCHSTSDNFNCKSDEDCGLNGICLDQSCSCENDTYPLFNGKCSARLSDPCLINSDCKDGKGMLECVEKVCDCKSMLFNTAIMSDKGELECRVRVGSGGECSENVTCVPQSACVKKGANYLCECEEGYSSNLDGLCYLSHGSDCDYIDQKDSENGEISECNFDRGLVCKNGKCRCLDESLVYEKGQCLVMLGRKCLNSREMYGEIMMKCEDKNSECVESSEGAFCICKEGFHRMNFKSSKRQYCQKN